MMIELAASLALVVLGANTSGASQKELGVGQQQPWTQRATREQQLAADALFQEGNTLLDNSVFTKAAEQYRKALEHWNHPSIHYNLGLALVNMGRAQEAHEHLSEALRYDKSPLDSQKQEIARGYLKLVERQLSYVELSCDVEGTSVGMDGKRLFVAPGRFVGWVQPGLHVFNVTHEGYPSNDRTRVLAPGQKVSLHISTLYTDGDLTRYSRRWSAWKPWTALGLGAALAAGGGLLHIQARDTYRGFDSRAASCGPVGCEPDPGLTRLRSRGDSFQKVAVGSYATGGALIVTGAVLAFVNRTQLQRMTPDEYEQQSGKVSLRLSNGGSGALATFRF